jgi:hypothetical protein
MKNRFNFYFYLLISLIIILSSCEKIIDLPIKNATPRIVIEATISDLNEPQIVYISQTVPFQTDTKKVPVSSAVVSVKEDGGATLTFVETKPGVYQSSAYKGVPGKKYTINVSSNGKAYTASSTMPLRVPLDSLSQTELTFFGTKNKFVVVHYNDPIGIPNFYNIRIAVNGKRRNSYYVESDRFNDGKPVKSNIFTDEPDLKTGDTVNVELQDIDEKTYRYLFSITQITGNGGPPTAPANPDSNFNNGALGYFSAHTSKKDKIIIK